MAKKLKDIDMSARDYKKFTKYRSNVQKEIRELRVILQTVEAKNKERVWLKNKSEGDIDDSKL